MSVAQQIKDRLDIVDYIQAHVPDLRRAGRTYKACCPFHNERTPSFVVNPDTQTWRCFGACAEGGDVFTFAQKRHGWDFSEALRELGKLAGVEVRKRTPEQKQREEQLDRLRGMLQTAADFYHEWLLRDTDEAQRVLAYTQQQRGFTMETIREWQIGFAPDGWQHMLGALTDLGYSADDLLEAGLVSRNDSGRTYDRFRNRLMIPIRDDRGRVIGFGARALSDEDNPKYLNSPQTPVFDKSSTLFGLDRAKQALRETETAVIVEGYMDVIQAHQAGYANVVAQMGTAMTEAQLSLIAPRYVKNIIMALDADAAGQNATRRSLEVARQALEADYLGKMSVDMRVLQIDSAKDPDDVLRETPQQWPEYVANALPVANFVIDMETSDLASDASLAERQAIARRLLPILTASENNFYTQENLQKLALRLRISEHDLLDWARELQRIEAAKQARRQTSTRDQAPPAVPNQTVPAAPDEMPPPFSPEDGVIGSNEEPPLFPDGVPLTEGDGPPHEDYDDLGLATVQIPRTTPTQSEAAPAPRLGSRNSSRATQAYCLRMMLLDPDALPHINRKLRELADGREEMLNGPLCSLDADDFTEADYRVLADAVQRALQQVEQEPLDFLRDTLADALLDELDTLMQAEAEHIHKRVRFRFRADFDLNWDQFSRHIQPGLDTRADVVRRALEIRQQRLERESQEFRFYLEDAQRQNDREAQLRYMQQFTTTQRALRFIHREIAQNNP